MTKIIRVDPSSHTFQINKDLSVDAAPIVPGPPIRMEGMTVGVYTMEHDAPHGGEMHPDGDEILYVFSGKLRVTGDTSDPIELGPGEACVVRKGEWHNVELLEKTQLMHITPGPNGDHRPLDQ